MATPAAYGTNLPPTPEKFTRLRADLRLRILQLTLALGLMVLLSGTAHSETGKNSGELLNHDEVCNYIVKHAGSPNFLRDHLIRFGIFDANNDGQVEIVEQQWAGTAGGDSYSLKALDGSVIDFRRKSEEFRWTYGGAWFRFQGQTYYLVFEEETARFIRAAMSMDPDNLLQVVCRFDNAVRQSIWPQVGRDDDTMFCKSLLTDHPPVAVEFEIPTRLTSERLDVEIQAARPRPIAQAAFDFDNDGTSENIVMIEVLSSAGRGCDFTYYDLLDAAGTEIREGPKRDRLRKLQSENVYIDPAYTPTPRCGGFSRWLEYNGEVALEIRYKGDSPRRGGHLYHQVWAVRETGIEKICDSFFQVQPLLQNGATQP